MSHTVTLSPSGHAFQAEPGETILAAGLRQGYALPFGCQSGTCASCRVHLLAGSVEDRQPAQALSPAERAAGYILMCQAHARSDLTLRLHQPPGLEHLRPRQLPVRVRERHRLSPDVLGLRVTLPRGEPFRYLPGQYVDFLLPDGRRRSFSIANAPGGETLEFHLRLTPGGHFAHWAQESMPEKAILRLEGPLGAFYLRADSTRPAVLVAGGTGFAPLNAMVEAMLAAGAPPRPVHLFWGARSARDLYLDERARGWAARAPWLRYTPVLSEPAADWAGERGFVHEAVLRAHGDLRGFEAYLAGPPVMVHAGKQAFIAAGLDADHLYYDSFDYAFATWPALG